jgi:hypothetical protein
LWTLSPMGCRSVSPQNPALQEGAKRARKALAAGNPVEYRQSGYTGPRYDYDYDPNSGLRIIDTGCFFYSSNVEYNRVVGEWIAKHGLPASSRKPRFVTLEEARKALQSGTSLRRGAHLKESQGKVLRWQKSTLYGSVDVFQLVAESNGKAIWSINVAGTESLQVAWSGRDSWFVEFPPGPGVQFPASGRHRDRGYIWHVDANGDGVLQTFDLAEAR